MRRNATKHGCDHVNGIEAVEAMKCLGSIGGSAAMTHSRYACLFFDGHCGGSHRCRGPMLPGLTHAEPAPRVQTELEEITGLVRLALKCHHPGTSIMLSVHSGTIADMRLSRNLNLALPRVQGGRSWGLIGHAHICEGSEIKSTVLGLTTRHAVSRATRRIGLPRTTRT